MKNKGGLTKGDSHAKGGIKMTVKSTGQQIEVEGGEGIINKHVMSSGKKVSYKGKKATPCEIASDLNQTTGNGVAFDCEETKNTDMTPTDPNTGFATGGEINNRYARFSDFKPEYDYAKGGNINWFKSVEGKGDPTITKRNFSNKNAAIDYGKGKISYDEYLRISEKESPVEEIETFYEPATEQEIFKALSEQNQKIKTNEGERVPKESVINADINKGEAIGVRLDIPSYTKNNTWVVSVHRGHSAGGRPISYQADIRLTDVTFGSNPAAAFKIAVGDMSKQTIGRMYGYYDPIEGNTPEERSNNTKALVERIKDSKNWKQVGMNPFRHSYFYLRENGMPITYSEEVVQIGGLVYAKNPIVGTPYDEEYEIKLPSVLKDYPNATKFSTGGNVEGNDLMKIDAKFRKVTMPKPIIAISPSFRYSTNNEEFMNTLAPIASTDDLRPAMTGVYFDSEKEQIAVTNAHILMRMEYSGFAKASGIYATDKVLKKEYKKLSKNISRESFLTFDEWKKKFPSYLTIDAKYPNVDAVIPDSYAISLGADVDIRKLYWYCSVLLKAKSKGDSILKETKGIYLQVTDANNQKELCEFNATLLQKLTKALIQLNNYWKINNNNTSSSDKFSFPYSFIDRNKPFCLFPSINKETLGDSKNVGLIMPIMMEDRSRGTDILLNNSLEDLPMNLIYDCDTNTILSNGKYYEIDASVGYGKAIKTNSAPKKEAEIKLTRADIKEQIDALCIALEYLEE